MAQYSIPLGKLVKRLNLGVSYSPQEDLNKILIYTSEVNRPGLMLVGYEEFFDATRIQILGNAEMSYLRHHLNDEQRRERIKALVSAKPPMVVVTRGREVFAELVEYGEEFEVPIVTTTETSSEFTSSALAILNVELAQRVTRHGVLVEIYGEGILILGESGVGKSETAVELLKRGHRLIADDAVELRKVSSSTIFGQAPENIRHFIELRGIGFINVARVFGSGAVKNTSKIDLVVVLEPWDKAKNYSRTGLEDNNMDIMGNKIPMSVIPVKPGRNLAVILEIAAMNNRQKVYLGYNAAKELLGKLGLNDDITGEGVTEIL